MTRSRKAAAAAVLVIAACAAILPAAALADPAPTGADTLPLKPARKVQFSTNEGTWMSLDVSADGRTLVFDHLGDLFTLPVEGGKARRITRGMAFDSQPRFSPDGRQIVFTSDRSGGQAVWIIDCDGERPRRLTQDNGPLFASPEFMPDGQRVLVSRRSGLRAASWELWSYDLRGGSGLQLTKSVEQVATPPDQWRNALGAAPSPDGRSVYFAKGLGQYFSYAAKLPIWQVVRLDLAKDLVEPITGDVEKHESADGHAEMPEEISGGGGGGMRPAVSPDGRWLAYASRVDERTGLRLQDLRTGESRWLVRDIDRDNQQSVWPDRDVVAGYAFSPDSRAIFAAFGGKIRKVDIATGEVTVVPMQVDVDLDLGPDLDFPRRVETGPVHARIVQSPSLSSDSKRYVVSTLGTLYVADAQTGRARTLLPSDQVGYQPSWSPDGRSIAYVDWSEDSGGNVWVVPSDGSGAPRRLTAQPGYYTHPRWSPNGARIAFNRASWHQMRARSGFHSPASYGNRLAWISSQGGVVHDIAPAGDAQYPHFRRDGARVFVATARGLESLRWDGTDRRLELGVKGRDFGGDPDDSPVTRISPDGAWMASLFRRQLYVTPTPLSGEPVTLDVSSPTVPLARVSTIGADTFDWSGDGRAITWSVGASVFRMDIADIRFPGLDRLEEGQIRQAHEQATKVTQIDIEAPRARPTADLLLQNARVITMRGDEVLAGADILVRGDRIAAVGAHGKIEPPADAKRIDLKGATVVPGFIDAHAHTLPIRKGLLGLPSYPLTAYLAYGVTTIRDPQPGQLDLFVYQDLIDAGRTLGPRVFSTGPGIFWTTDIKSLQDARDVIARYAHFYGVGTVKSYGVGDRRQRQWLAQAAREAGVAPTTEGSSDLSLDLTHAIDGFDLEHTLPITPLFDDVVTLMAKSRTAYNPTLLQTYGGALGDNYYWLRQDLQSDPKIARFLPPDYVESRVRQQTWVRDKENIVPSQAADLAKIIRAGGRVSTNSHGDFLGHGFHENMWAMASGGVTPLEVLRAATLSAADAIGLRRDLGSVEVGKLADLVVLDRDPLQDIKNASAIRFVIKGGVVHEGESLAEIWPRPRPGPVYWWRTPP